MLLRWWNWSVFLRLQQGHWIIQWNSPLSWQGCGRSNNLSPVGLDLYGGLIDIRWISMNDMVFHDPNDCFTRFCLWWWTFVDELFENWGCRKSLEPALIWIWNSDSKKTQQLVELKPNHNHFCFKPRPVCISAVAWVLLSPFEVIKVIYFELGMTEDGKPQVLNVRVSQSTFNLWFGPMYLFWGKKWPTGFNQKGTTNTIESRKHVGHDFFFKAPLYKYECIPWRIHGMHGTYIYLRIYHKKSTIHVGMNQYTIVPWIRHGVWTKSMGTATAVWLTGSASWDPQNHGELGSQGSLTPWEHEDFEAPNMEVWFRWVYAYFHGHSVLVSGSVS